MNLLDRTLRDIIAEAYESMGDKVVVRTLYGPMSITGNSVAKEIREGDSSLLGTVTANALMRYLTRIIKDVNREKP